MMGRFFGCGALVYFVLASLQAQSPPPVSTSPSPVSKSTVILSDTSQIDKNQAVFSGNVSITSTDFSMKADTMTVTFVPGEAGKIDRILSEGNVVIEQPSRTAKSRQAEYVALQDKITLTGSPEIIQAGGNRVTGTVITIYRRSQRMEMDGHRNTITLYEDPSPSTASPASP